MQIQCAIALHRRDVQRPLVGQIVLDVEAKRDVGVAAAWLVHREQAPQELRGSYSIQPQIVDLNHVVMAVALPVARLVLHPEKFSHVGPPVTNHTTKKEREKS